MTAWRATPRPGVITCCLIRAHRHCHPVHPSVDVGACGQAGGRGLGWGLGWGGRQVAPLHEAACASRRQPAALPWCGWYRHGMHGRRRHSLEANDSVLFTGRVTPSFCQKRLKRSRRALQGGPRPGARRPAADQQEAGGTREATHWCRARSRLSTAAHARLAGASAARCRLGPPCATTGALTE